MATQYVDIIGSGFVQGIPGEFANCRVYYDGTSLLHVGALYVDWPTPPPPARTGVLVSVTAFGAAGNNSTDDTAAIQAAINAVAARGGGTVNFPPGIYLVSATIQLVGGIAYIGTSSMDGGQGTIIKQVDHANLPAVLASYEWYNNQTFSGHAISIRDLIVDGNSGNNINTHGIVCQNYDAHIRDCMVQYVPGAGIVLTSATRNGSNSSNGISEMHVESCKVNTCGTYGIWGHDNQGKLTDCYIRDCEISTTTLDGIWLEGAGGWQVVNNHLYGGLTNGINCAKCFATLIQGNYIDGFAYSSTGAYYYGISVAMNGPRPTLILGNTITPDFEFNDATNYNYIGVFGATIGDQTVAIVSDNHIVGGYVLTTSTTSITAGTTAAITPASMERIWVGQSLGLDTAGNFETITVASVTATSFTPTTAWAHNHSGTYNIYSNKATSKSIALTYQTAGSQQSSGYPNTIISHGNRADNVGQYLLTDSYTTLGPVQIDGSIAQLEAFPQTPTTGTTIFTANYGVQPVNPAANVTGMILQAGTTGGQSVTVLNQSAFTITFAVSGISQVASGTSAVIAANDKRIFVWDSTKNLWY